MFCEIDFFNFLYLLILKSHIFSLKMAENNHNLVDLFIICQGSRLKTGCEQSPNCLFWSSKIGELNGFFTVGFYTLFFSSLSHFWTQSYFILIHFYALILCNCKKSDERSQPVLNHTSYPGKKIYVTVVVLTVTGLNVTMCDHLIFTTVTFLSLKNVTFLYGPIRFYNCGIRIVLMFISL